MEFYIYLGVALIGSGLFLIKLFAYLFGLESNNDFDFSSHSFEVFSLQSILATMMGLGWAGLALHYETSISEFFVLLCAICFGFSCGLFSSFLLFCAKKLNSIPTQSFPKNKMQGLVYLTIPQQKEGRGKIEIILNGKKMIIDALTNSNTPIKSFTVVKITDVLSSDLVVVDRI